MIIAIDGPAASGKGTIARQLAQVYGLHHLDTGLIYRAVAKAVLDAGYPPDDTARAIEAAMALDPTKFDDNALKSQAITEAASVVAAIPEVRQALMNYQRHFATQAARRGARRPRYRHRHRAGRGREAFVVATPEVRAARRVLRTAGTGRAGRREGGPGRPAAARRARFPAHRRPLKGRARRALARHHAFGYRRGIPGRRRHHRSRPNGPKARLTALSSLEVSPFAASSMRPDKALSRPSG